MEFREANCFLKQYAQSAMMERAMSRIYPMSTRQNDETSRQTSASEMSPVENRSILLSCLQRLRTFEQERKSGCMTKKNCRIAVCSGGGKSYRTTETNPAEVIPPPNPRKEENNGFREGKDGTLRIARDPRRTPEFEVKDERKKNKREEETGSRSEFSCRCNRRKRRRPGAETRAGRVSGSRGWGSRTMLGCARAPERSKSVLKWGRHNYTPSHSGTAIVLRLRRMGKDGGEQDVGGGARSPSIVSRRSTPGLWLNTWHIPVVRDPKTVRPAPRCRAERKLRAVRGEPHNFVRIVITNR